MGGACSTNWRADKCIQYKILVGKHEKATLTSMRRWEDNIKMNIKGLGCEGVRVN
jgi:hypothetical protein